MLDERPLRLDGYLNWDNYADYGTAKFELREAFSSIELFYLEMSGTEELFYIIAALLKSRAPAVLLLSAFVGDRVVSRLKGRGAFDYVRVR